MQAQPLPKKFYDALLALKVEELCLHWSGGDDQGYLDIQTVPDSIDIGDLHDQIDEWAWLEYGYNGAGDGSDYGDDITYNLTKGIVTTSEWFTIRQESEPETERIELQEEE